MSVSAGQGEQQRSLPSSSLSNSANASELRPKPHGRHESPNIDSKKTAKNYHGFIAGVFSGISKLAVGHPFDTIKVRMQTTNSSQFAGPLACLASTIKNEGVRGLYKGATPPLGMSHSVAKRCDTSY